METKDTRSDWKRPKVDSPNLLESIEAELPMLVWECATPFSRTTHFTGRGTKWTMQLIVIDAKQRIGAAYAGTLMVKLPEDLAARVEKLARGAFE